jgi:hypothetical protein
MIIRAYGTPATQGSKRYLGVTKAGRGRVVETSSKTAPWRSDVQGAAREAIEEYTQTRVHGSPSM